MKHKIGNAAKVEMYISAKKECSLVPCVITGIVTALDRPYRINVLLNTGVEIKECAPECVIQENTKL